MNIDCHAHYIPPAVLRAAALNPDVELATVDGVTRLRFPGLDWSPPLPAVIADRDAVVSWQRAAGIDLQILSCWTDLLGYTLTAASAEKWCAAVNEAMAEDVEHSPSLEAMGVVPLQDPRRSAASVARIRELGLKGIVIGSSTPAALLDDDALTPFWAAAAEAGLPVLMHPIFLAPDPATVGPGIANAIGRGNATNVAIGRLLLAGVLHRHPHLRLVVCHGGAGLPMMLGRLERNRQLHDDFRYSVAEGFARLYFDSVVCDPVALRLLLQVARADQVLLGSDFPFPWEPHPVDTVAAADLGPEVTRLICEHTPRDLFGLTRPAAPVRADRAGRGGSSSAAVRTVAGA